MTAELADGGRGVHVEIEVAVQAAVHVGQVLRVVAQVGADEGRVGVALDDPVPLGQEGVVAWEPRPAEVPVGMQSQFFPSLIMLIQRLEEGHRVGGVDEDGYPQLPGLGPQRVQPGVVHGDEAALGVPVPQPQLLEDLEPRRSRLHLPLHLLRHPLAEAGGDVPEIGSGEIDEPVPQHLPESAHPFFKGDAQHLQDAQVDHVGQPVGLHISSNTRRSSSSPVSERNPTTSVRPSTMDIGPWRNSSG